MSGADAKSGLRDRFFDAALRATRAGTLEWIASPIRRDDIEREPEFDRRYIAKFGRYAVRAHAEPARCVFEIVDPAFPESYDRVLRCETRRGDHRHRQASALIAAIREALGPALRIDAAQDAIETLEDFAPPDPVTDAESGAVSTATAVVVVGAEIDCPFGRVRIVAVPPDPAVLCGGNALARWGHDCVADAIPIGRSDSSAMKELADLAEKFASHGLGLEIEKPARSIKPGDLVNSPFGMIRVVDPADLSDKRLLGSQPPSNQPGRDSK